MRPRAGRSIRRPSSPASTSNPIDTWLDGSEVIPYENWPGTPPVGMAILCGTMAEVGGLPGAGDHGFPALAAGQVLATGKTLPRQRVAALAVAGRAERIRLVGAGGPEQWRGSGAHGEPSLRPRDQPIGTSTSRRQPTTAARGWRPDASGYTNLFLAGDWTDYGYNLGCFEGAVMSGLMAANAITKDPRPILRDPYSGT